MSIEDSKPSYTFDPVTWRWMIQPGGKQIECCCRIRSVHTKSSSVHFLYANCCQWIHQFGRHVALDELAKWGKSCWTGCECRQSHSDWNKINQKTQAEVDISHYWVSNVRAWKSNAGLQHASAYFVARRPAYSHNAKSWGTSGARNPEMSTWICTSIASLLVPLSPDMTALRKRLASVATLHKPQNPAGIHTANI